MAVEEPSIVASASYIAKIVRETGGFKTEASERIMIGQIQVIGCPDFGMAKEKVLQEKEMLINAANYAYHSLLILGGGVVDFDVLIIIKGLSILSHIFILTILDI